MVYWLEAHFKGKTANTNLNKMINHSEHTLALRRYMYFYAQDATKFVLEKAI